MDDFRTFVKIMGNRLVGFNVHVHFGGFPNFGILTKNSPILRGSKVHELFLSYFGLFALQFWHKNTPIRDGNSIEIYG